MVGLFAVGFSRKGAQDRGAYEGVSQLSSGAGPLNMVACRRSAREVLWEVCGGLLLCAF